MICAKCRWFDIGLGRNDDVPSGMCCYKGVFHFDKYSDLLKVRHVLQLHSCEEFEEQTAIDELRLKLKHLTNKEVTLVISDEQDARGLLTTRGFYSVQGFGFSEHGVESVQGSTITLK